MKKIALVLSLAFLAFSCSSDDDGGSSVSEADLVGTWTLASIVEDGESEELSVCELRSTLVITENEVVETDSYGEDAEDCSEFTDTYEYVLRGNEFFEIDSEDGEEYFEGEVSISGDNLIFTFEVSAGSQSFSEITTYVKS